MTIQHPPPEEMPRVPPIDTPELPDDQEEPDETPPEPEQRAPGEDQPPVGAPTDEPGVQLD